MNKITKTAYKVAIYARKSSETRDRQERSIESQIETLLKIAEDQNLNIVKVIKEAKSAYKIDNRDGFNELCKDIQSGAINAVLCWKVDRLVRNMIEGGPIAHFLQKGILRVIMTPHTCYYPEDNILPLIIGIAMANQYSIDLSRNVLRGNKTKLEKGGFCHQAPCGYINDTKNKIVIPDPERFHLVKKMFNMYLSGQYSIKEICRIANEEWGFKTIRRKTRGGNSLTTTHLHSMLTNPFYCGWIKSKRTQAKGIHKPLITKEEFKEIDHILQKRGQSRKQRNLKAKISFSYTGLMSCEECGSSITAEIKIKYKCPKCGKSHCSRHPKMCSCGELMSQKIIDNGRRYVYYRCIKRELNKEGKKCSQPCIREEVLEEQILQYLQQISISDAFADWLLVVMGAACEYERKKKHNVIVTFEKSLVKAKKRLNNFVRMRANDEISHEQFIRFKVEVEQEINKMENSIQNVSSEQWRIKAKNASLFLKNLRNRFAKLSNSDKKSVLQKICSNLSLNDRKLSLDWVKPFKAISDLEKEQKYSFEPILRCSSPTTNDILKEEDTFWLSKIDTIRTLFEEKELPKNDS